ncbi:MAG: TerB family tellurite resistance protein [Candidatus Latescibacterota bacterium]|nr:MAG: TerB family tellurite resistance protein [Candidatus Latescibacterota bacterium]
MIDILKRILGTGDKPDGSHPLASADEKGAQHHDVHLATCAIFLEMANIDSEFGDEERDHILSTFESEYGLSREEVLELKRASREELEKSLDVWQFTNAINQHYSNEEKTRIVELLWELVYSDGKMDEHENYFMHKLAKLLRLTHRELIDAKLIAIERSNK